MDNLEVKVEDKSAVLAHLNADEFVPKSFVSTSTKKAGSILIDLNKDTIAIPKLEEGDSQEEDPLFNPAVSIILNCEKNMYIQ